MTRRMFQYLILTSALICATVASAPSAVVVYTDYEMHTLLAPIALYPDPLVAQILPACTHIGQLDAAYVLTNRGVSFAVIDRQPWDVSVLAVAHYPSVVSFLVGNRDWAVAVGQAYVVRPADVLVAIQYLRRRAFRYGILFSSPRLLVLTSGPDILIVPAVAGYLYVPIYDPYVAFVIGLPFRRSVITFSPAFIIGDWLDRDINWRSNVIFYHGWEGGGWIAKSRPFIRITNKYVNKGFRTRGIKVDRSIVSKSISGFRGRLAKQAKVKGR